MRMRILKLDYDGRPLRRAEIRRRLEFAGFEIAAISGVRSPSGNGWHVYIITDPEPADAMTVVALQAVLGSDPLREAANVQRVRTLPTQHPWWADRWNVLYSQSLQRAKR